MARNREGGFQLSSKLILLILSKDEAIKYKPRGKAVVIRMLEPEEAYVSLKGNYVRKLCLPVHDITPSINNPSNFVLFSSEHAQTLVQFFKEINEVKDLEEVVIHCHAGISRSSAVAIAFAWFTHNKTLEDDILTSRRYAPNPHILACMAKALGISKEKESVIQRFQDDEIEETNILF